MNTIINGPSKMDLITSLVYAMNQEQRLLCTFTTTVPNSGLNIKVKDKVSIVAMEHEDGSGESWNIRGLLVRNNGSSRKVKIYYRTDTRKGFMEDYT